MSQQNSDEADDHANHPEIFVLEGPYGSGKGTHGKELAARRSAEGIPTRFIETSGLLKHVDDPRVKAAMASRQGVPTDIVCGLVRQALSEAAAAGEDVVLDGFPRFYPGVGLAQVECFAEMVRDLKLSVTVARFRVKEIDFCHARIDQRIAEKRAAKQEPRPDDVNLEIRTAGLKYYFSTLGVLLRAYRRYGFDIKTISLLDPNEEFGSVATRLDECLSGKGHRIPVDVGTFRLWTGQPGSPAHTQVTAWFRPEASVPGVPVLAAS